jgi:hypothetical protein
MRGHAFKAMLRTGSLDDVFAFFGVDRERTAPLEVTVEVATTASAYAWTTSTCAWARCMRAARYRHHRRGQAFIEAKLAADRLDWKQALEDMGHARKANEPSEFIFRDKPLAWKTFTHLRGFAARSMPRRRRAARQRHRTPGPRAKFTFDDDRLELNLWQSRLLGGTGHGSMRFDGTKKTIRFRRCRREPPAAALVPRARPRPPLSPAGPMHVRMTLDMQGDTWRDLAASRDRPGLHPHGTRRLRPADGRGDWEALMVAFLEEGFHRRDRFRMRRGEPSLREGRRAAATRSWAPAAP